MGGAGRKLREGCVETERMREGGREACCAAVASVWVGGRTCLWSEGFFFLSFFDLVEKFCQVPKTHLLLVNRLPR